MLFILLKFSHAMGMSIYFLRVARCQAHLSYMHQIRWNFLAILLLIYEVVFRFASIEALLLVSLSLNNGIWQGALNIHWIIGLSLKLQWVVASCSQMVVLHISFRQLVADFLLDLIWASWVLVDVNEFSNDAACFFSCGKVVVKVLINNLIFTLNHLLSSLNTFAPIVV